MKKLLRTILPPIGGACLALLFYHLNYARSIADDALFANLYRNHVKDAIVDSRLSGTQAFYYWKDFTVTTAGATNLYKATVPWWGIASVTNQAAVSSTRKPSE
ncbi:MAG: hypothetical protein M0Q93_11050 [Terrimicrobiaceae bacterium]|nr:hypothetical protein [Terrimicrobiaceae bacterium]